MSNPPSIPFLKGQNVLLKLYQDGRSISILTKNFKVNENATESNDGCNGEIRDRLDKVTNFYEGSCDIYDGDAEFMTAYIAAQDANDAQGLPLLQTAAVQKKYRDGTRKAYLMQEAVFGPWDYNPGERSATSMTSLKFRFRFYKPVPSI